MTRSARAPRAAAGIAAAAVAALVAGCAPHLVTPPSLEPGVVRARFETALRARREQGADAQGDVSVWLHREGAGDPPGVSAHLWLEAPDAFRLRVDGLLGTAVEAAARGDSLIVRAPVWKLGAVSDEASDPGGLGAAGSFVWTVLSGSFAPPDSAWRAATVTDSATIVRWRLGRDDAALWVGGDGLPALVTLDGADHPQWSARYVRWQAWNQGDRVPWPAHLVIGESGGRTRATLKVQSLTLRPRGAVPLVRLVPPRNALRVTRREGIALLERLAREGASAADSMGTEP